MFCLLGNAFRLCLICPSRPIALAFLALKLPYLKWVQWLVIPTAHIADGSEPLGGFCKLPLCPSHMVPPQSQCFLY